MSAIILTTLSYLLLYKYVALFIVAYLAALLLPLPSSTSLMAAGAFASQGYLSIYSVLLVALAANILGDVSGFVISRRYGKDFLMHIGLRKTMESKRYANLGNFIVENSGITIFVTRFFGQIGPLVNILTGLSEDISFRRYFLYESTGEIAYVLCLGLTGYFLGGAWQNMTGAVQFTIEGLAIIAIFFIIGKIFSKRIHHQM